MWRSFFWWCVFSLQDREGSPGTVIRGQAEFCLKCEWANFHQPPLMLGEVPGATACQGSSLEDGLPSKKKKKNIKYIEKKKKKKQQARHCIVWQCFLFYSVLLFLCVKFININEQNLYNPHTPPREAPASSATSFLSFFIFFYPLFFFLSFLLG